MDVIIGWLAMTWEQLLARASGPLNFRLVVMPTVVTIMAIRAGMRDAREGNPTFLTGIFTKPEQRQRGIRSAIRDVGKIFIVALVLDSLYQIFVLRMYSIAPMLAVAVVCAIVPYCLVRGPAAVLAKPFYRRKAEGVPPPAEAAAQQAPEEGK